MEYSRTVDEAWDHDPEARLSACCVQERLRQLEQGPAIGQTTSASLHDITSMMAALAAGKTPEECQRLLPPPCDVSGVSTSGEYSGSTDSTLPLVAVRHHGLMSGYSSATTASTSSSDDLPPKESSIS